MRGCLDALKTLARALALYLKSSGQKTLSISSLTGQESIKIAFRALARFHDSSFGYPLFSEAMVTLLLEGTSWLEKINWRVILTGDEAYLVVPLDFAKEFLNAEEEVILKYMLNSGACREKM